MESTPQFRSDLYQGTARYYDRYRVPYPALLIDDLVIRGALSGTGRLLDKACGPGRVTFALSEHFADVLAIDQEEESVSYAKALAAERGAAHIHWRTGRAEDLHVAGHFGLVTVGGTRPASTAAASPPYRNPVASAHRDTSPYCGHQCSGRDPPLGKAALHWWCARCRSPGFPTRTSLRISRKR